MYDWKGKFKDSALESLFLESRWQQDAKTTGYSYLIMGALFLLAGFGDFYRDTSSFGLYLCLAQRLLTFFAGVGIFLLSRKEKPSEMFNWLGSSFKFQMATLILTTAILSPNSPTLAVSVMAIMIGFFLFLPGDMTVTIFANILLVSSYYLSTPYYLEHMPKSFIYNTLIFLNGIIIGSLIVRKVGKTQRSEFKANVELKKANHEKDKFLSIIAHDLKNPLTYLLQTSHLLSQNFDRISQEKGIKYSRKIHSTINNVNNLLEDLLRWSLVQSNNLSANIERVNLNEIVRDNFDLLSDMAEKKNIQLIKNLIDESSLGDEKMISTIIRNLITNALKFSTDGGTIEVYSQISKDGEYIEICVRDYGIGMSEEVLDNIFRPQTFTSSTGTKGEKGTGFGLPLCFELAELNEGTILVESSEGKGSLFKLVVPLYKEISRQAA